MQEFNYDWRWDDCSSVFRVIIEKTMHHFVGAVCQIDKYPDNLVLEVVLDLGSQFVILYGRLIKPVAKSFHHVYDFCAFVDFINWD